MAFEPRGFGHAPLPPSPKAGGSVLTATLRVLDLLKPTNTGLAKRVTKTKPCFRTGFTGLTANGEVLTPQRQIFICPRLAVCRIGEKGQTIPIGVLITSQFLTLVIPWRAKHEHGN